jgi:hypothetical protein
VKRILILAPFLIVLILNDLGSEEENEEDAMLRNKIGSLSM